jgi:parallel beta-helix repeat protein
MRFKNGKGKRRGGIALFLVVIFSLAAFFPPAGQQATAQLNISFHRETNTIEVKGQGEGVSLTDIDNELGDEDLLEQTAPFEWFLKVNLKTYELMRLELHGQAAGGDCDWLKLKSDSSGFVIVESSNGQISIKNTRITSWDGAAGTFDTAYRDGSGRANVSIKHRSARYTGNRMDVIDSEIAYLGFFEESAYGISWKVLAEEGVENPAVLGQGLTGDITGSKFHDNYFGLYFWGTGDVQVTNNEIYNNFFYGFDAHTETQRTLVENNYTHDNGGHGIIFAERCTSNIIRNNRAINNTGHGIMLHELSDGNTIIDNEITGNDDGIPVFESSNNIVRGNTIRDNRTGLRIYGRANVSSGNLFEDNEISGSAAGGVFMYDGSAANIFRGNRIFNNAENGVYLKNVVDNVFTGNEIYGNDTGVQLDSGPDDAPKPSRGNRFEDNDIRDNTRYGIYSYPREGANTFTPNTFSGNALGDIRYAGLASDEGVSGPGLLGPVLIGVIVLVTILSIIVTVLRQRAASKRKKQTAE